MSDWVTVCGIEDIEREDVVGVVVGDRQLALYRSPDDQYFATDGYCTHEQFLLAEGLVMGTVIECAKHHARFDYTTGRRTGGLACNDLRSYAVRVTGGQVEVELPQDR